MLRMINKNLFVLLILNLLSCGSSENNKEVLETKKKIYHDDFKIDKLITEYNKIAEFRISPDMVSEGAYRFNAHIEINGVNITVYNSKRIFIDYSDAGKSDKDIVPLFRDFSKTLNTNITDETINKGIKELRSGKYEYYKEYNMDGISCTYLKKKYSDGSFGFSIKTGYASYE